MDEEIKSLPWLVFINGNKPCPEYVPIIFHWYSIDVE